MAANTNKRLAIKHVRDKAKAAYEKKDVCFICNSSEDLELHHTNSLSLLLTKWAKDNDISINTDDEVIAIRERFIAEHHSEIYDEVFTLCLKHHLSLHRIFGKSPPLSTSPKQSRWIEKQKAKALGIEDDTVKKGAFSKFY